jgi:hypothetical protein
MFNNNVFSNNDLTYTYDTVIKDNTNSSITPSTIITSNKTSGFNWSSTKSVSIEGDTEINGTLTIKGKDIGNILEKIEDRLAILSEPDPKKLEKFAALKKAYDHYKLLEKLIGEE